MHPRCLHETGGPDLWAVPANMLSTDDCAPKGRRQGASVVVHSQKPAMIRVSPASVSSIWATAGSGVLHYVAAFGHNAGICAVCKYL